MAVMKEMLRLFPMSVTINIQELQKRQDVIAAIKAQLLNIVLDVNLSSAKMMLRYNKLSFTTMYTSEKM